MYFNLQEKTQKIFNLNLAEALDIDKFIGKIVITPKTGAQNPSFIIYDEVHQYLNPTNKSLNIWELKLSKFSTDGNNLQGEFETD